MARSVRRWATHEFCCASSVGSKEVLRGLRSAVESPPRTLQATPPPPPSQHHSRCEALVGPNQVLVLSS